MAMHVALKHKTTYHYDRAVGIGSQIIRLRPAAHCRTPILSYSLKVEPTEHFVNWQQDPHGNYLARLVFEKPAKKFSVTVDLVAEMTVYNPFGFFVETAAEHYPFRYDKALTRELLPYLAKRRAGTLLAAFIKEIDDTKVRSIDYLVAINRHLKEAISYGIRLEPGVQTPEETLSLRSGSCRDSAWLLCQVLRHKGLAARFVSGYLIQIKPDVKSLDGPSGAETDFTDLHAWTEVYLPGAGWIGLDPTSGLLAGEGHIPLACTPQPGEAAAISGGVDECESTFEYEMTLQRIHESPRVTKPYTEEQWKKIDALGDQVDRRLKKGDVRLTMGGEPTFVSIDDMEGDEWNTTAVGPMKRNLSEKLIRRLQKRFAPGGFLHYGQGKWYPGEPLPRWSFGCYWRKDGVPIWENMDLIAQEDKNYLVTAEDSQEFLSALADRLDLDTNCIIPAFEDSWYYLWKERRLPSNVDPLKSQLKNKEERARLAQIFEQGLNKPVGHTLPIKRLPGNSGPAWATGSWFLRPDTLFLLPGDSPMGLRLPLESLPWVKPSEYPHTHDPDFMQKMMPLPPRALKSNPSFYPAPSENLREQEMLRRSDPKKERRPEPQESAPWIVRTAMCVEPREGKLHIFMPPVEALEDYLTLLSAVEDTAEQLNMPVIVEGYAPPADPRIQVIKVTPDPGVIEVNVHPASSWREMVEITTDLYEDAHHTRLGTEKFMVDGRHCGTGGGNHIVMGGSTPAESPFLRRPDLLRSLINYWHNHPSLSYLFSGLFVGPTCQAPRIDEARNDSLYEMEIAFNQIPDKGHTPPWLVDRVFRNLLTDVTGNTHRSEFCIDKLFDPNGPTGRLGLLELRSFEMPPHERMSLTQQLLMRALISEFWDKPYRQTLVPWGTELHDRFMLPHFVWQDFQDVMGDLNQVGLPFQEEWFAPHQEFRFPRHGETNYREINMEIRHALEPWHVLGEEGAPGGNVRYVDSSIERVQVKVQGMIGSRYAMLCNGRRVPLHSTGTTGEYVAGVRYRAWQPPSCLHPTIPVQSPVIFDLLDTWNNKTVAGCAYHVAHPGGLSPDTFPVNSYEAEARRVSRFLPHGHTPGTAFTPRVEKSTTFPFTLDLRTYHQG
ncbi:MAG: transglutaminase family protein [Blastochloris sp.]|nr:transglutaminase family protein [Blastochloris sp.]